MFFTSYEFLFLFVPLAWLGCAALLHWGRSTAATWWLAALSLYFYASLDSRHLPHLLASVAVNYLVASAIARRRDTPRLAQALLAAGVLFDIAFLAWLKYAGLLSSDGGSIVIPLGISFYTLQQIGFLISVHNSVGERVPTPSRYLLFVAFFPYVIAGPVVTRQEMTEQFETMSLARMRGLFLPALTLFSIGLFKKVVVADNLGTLVDRSYAALAHGSALSFGDAWGASTLYTLQIYFDFSGYSDMAAGLAGLFGLNLPRNFQSPLKAASIMEFWRRWHMSATRFFTNHVYLPLVLRSMRAVLRSGLGPVPRYLATVLLPMLVTFFLIGLWHGAGVTAMVFGLLMGAAISVNHLWVKLELPALPRGLGWAATILVVIVGMVFSRSDDMATASSMLRSLAGLGGGTSALLDPATTWASIAALGAVVLGLPNSNDIMESFPVVLHETWDAMPRWHARLVWPHGTRGALFASVVFCTSAVLIPKAAQFIYYRF
jgi:D-alanyl-lipoteichoic acid acyltransferase DltB (MBOAT superfamily)